MADIRCSNCQTLNPADAVLCKKCGRPLIDESAGWLDSLRGDSEPSSFEEPATSGSTSDEAMPNEEIPDWLQRIRQRNQEEQDQPSPFSSPDEPSEEVPDWLTSLQASSGEAASTPGAGGESDWLQSLRGPETPNKAEPPAAAGPFESSPADESRGETPDWMQKLETWKSESDQPAEQPEPEQPIDWVSRIGGEETPAQTAAASAEDDQDWLSGLQAAAEPSGEGSPFGESEESAPAGEEMDWLSRLGGENQPGETSQVEPQSPFSMPQEPAEASQSFSWESEPPTGEIAPSEPSETPDWLRQFETHEPVPSEESSFESPAASEPGPAEPANETPDWLRQFEAQAPKAEEPTFETPSDGTPESAEPAGDLPDWLSSFSSQETEQPAAETQPWAAPASEAEAEPTADVPDWLQNYQPVETPQQPIEPAEPVAPIAEEPLDESFSWQSLGIPADESASEKAEPVSANPFAAANLPDWLDETNKATPRGQYDENLIPPAEPVGDLEGSKAFAQSGLPEWLDESGTTIPAAEAASEELPAEGGDESLEAAELPSWLQSMRPIEMVAPKPASTEEKKTEKAGPLAGLTGVLPSEDLAGQYIKPPFYSVKLRVSEKQRVHASLIESLISEETQPQPIPAERSEAPQRVLRFLIAAVLIIAVLLPMLNFLPTFPASDILPQELIAFETTLADESVIPPGSAVLLALEYEPGLSGELQTASEAVIRQLAERNVRLTVISTSPTGSILAETLLEKAEFDPAFVVNLGYLAGGSTGLQSFSLSPIQAAPATLQGQLAPWNDGNLTGVSKLTDFAATLVLTDDPDKGRNWVEQVQPALGSKPLLMISSAQAAPLLLPYYNSGQIQGIISGINGAAGFESLAQSSGTASLLRGSYQYGMLLTALLILVGSLITGIVTSIARGKAEKEA